MRTAFSSIEAWEFTSIMSFRTPAFNLDLCLMETGVNYYKCNLSTNEQSLVSTTSTVHIVYIDCLPEIEDNHELDETLSNTNFNELDITYAPKNEQHDVSKELFGVVSAPVDDATHWHDGDSTRNGRCGDTCVGLDSCHLVMPRHLYETRRLLH